MKRVFETDFTPDYVRAGIIPFTIENGTIFFAFGFDNNFGQLGDFGGHYESKDIDLLNTAIREYHEESLNIFGSLTRKVLNDCYALEGPETIEILLPVAPPMYQYIARFNNLNVGPDHEVQEIVWLSRSQLLNLLDNPDTSNMYYRIYDCLYKYRHYL